MRAVLPLNNAEKQIRQSGSIHQAAQSREQTQQNKKPHFCLHYHRFDFFLVQFLTIRQPCKILRNGDG